MLYPCWLRCSACLLSNPAAQPLTDGKYPLCHLTLASADLLSSLLAPACHGSEKACGTVLTPLLLPETVRWFHFTAL